MNGGSWLFVILCALIGYLLVSHVVRSGGRSSTPPKPSNPVAPDEPAQPASADADALPWHEVLGIEATATLDEITSAYRSLIAQYHPDKVQDMGVELRELATRKSQQIIAAYQRAKLARQAG